jgi:hypothetical protein
MLEVIRQQADHVATLAGGICHGIRVAVLTAAGN